MRRFVLFILLLVVVLNCFSCTAPSHGLDEPSSGGELSDALEREICAAYDYTYRQIRQVQNSYELGVLYEVTNDYGEFNGCRVVYVRGKDAEENGDVKLYIETIGGCELGSNRYSLPIVYKDGAIYPLRVAYEQGLLSKKDLHDIKDAMGPYTVAPDLPE